MNIRKNSLHYKVYAWTYSTYSYSPPKETNLCQYFRRLALSPLFVLCTPWFWLGLIWCVLVFFWTWQGLDHGWRYIAVNTGLGLLMGAGIMLCAFFCFAIAPELYNRLIEKLCDDRPRQPGLIRSWLAAKKQQVCPLVKFEE
jgi:hypothetical protein